MRTLNRPMFRTGGSTGTGITSGLAPRLRYSEGKNFEERMEERQAVYDKYMPKRGKGNLSEFLIDFGLNVAGATPSGSILSTAAQAAQEPYGSYTAKKAAAASEKDRFTRNMIQDISEQMSEEEQERLGAGTGKKQYEYRGKYDDYTDLLGIQRQLEEKLRKAQEAPTGVPPGPGGLPNAEIIQKIKDDLEDNKKQQLLFADEEKDYILEKLIRDPMVTAEEVEEYIRTKKETGVGTMPESNATGGRVGYATAGPVMPTAMPEQQHPTMNTQASGGELTFQELRSRLPSTVPDDVVQLLASSEEALTEFANIQTERDITSFNRKYQVRLVLPQEA
jgi:hypothetical protein